MSEFTSQGAEREYPNLYADERYISELSTRSDEQLEAMQWAYIEFIGDEETFLPHRDRALRLLQHVHFEQRFRRGDLDDYLIEEIEQ